MKFRDNGSLHDWVRLCEYLILSFVTEKKENAEKYSQDTLQVNSPKEFLSNKDFLHLHQDLCKTFRHPVSAELFNF